MSETTISASALKARCAEIVARIARERRPVTITRRGRPVARLVPIGKGRTPLFGCLRGSITVLGNVVDPLNVRSRCSCQKGKNITSTATPGALAHRLVASDRSRHETGLALPEEALYLAKAY